MRIAVSGYVSAQAGSVASANALLLRGLLDRGCEITFFSKASFVDPRPSVGLHPLFHFVDVDNRFSDRCRAWLSRVPVASFISGLIDSFSYNRLLVHRMREHHADSPFDLVLWLGEYAQGRVAKVPSVSFAQGPPGTDARSILQHFEEISKLAGSFRARRLKLLATLRLSKIGLPPLRHSDHIIVGSEQSRRTLCNQYAIPAGSVHCLPYPIDLQAFRPGIALPRHNETRCVWLGRIIPRKRLDVFLDGAAEAIRGGMDLRLTVVGGVGFVPGYDKLLASFAFPDRLEWIPFLPREQVPELLHEQDVLAQPSDEENFGSSVAEAQACGLPVIVGATNGNADYLGPEDIRLNDDSPSGFARALDAIARRQPARTVAAAHEAHRRAAGHFELSRITDRLIELLRSFSTQ